MSTLERRASAAFPSINPKSATRRPAYLTDSADDLFAVRVRELNYRFGEGELSKQVLFDNQLDLVRGEIVIMTGPSGSGKTTLLTLIGGLRTVQDGKLMVLGRELHGLSPQELVNVRRDIGFIFQAHNLFDSLTAVQNVAMSMELKGYDRATVRQKAEEMLTLLGLDHRLNYKPENLSGGQKQRVAIARALASRPRLILADEPTAALDRESGRDVVELFQKIAKEDKTTVLMVTHDNRILDVADRIVNMVDGRVISDVLVQEAATIADFLQKIDLFKSLSAATLAEVADKMSLERFSTGDTVIRQGDPGDKLYVIRSGKAEVHVTRDGQTRQVATLGAGDFFGEAALISGEPRNATVKAGQPLEAYTLGKDDFKRVMDASPPFHDVLRRVLFARQ
ncbi:MAG TPA: ATP-binding cassette domain-containing protein [Pirellulales bacterium]|nr:ATP-binding cassette domain-containing protein [Pirellulales bacterium]